MEVGLSDRYRLRSRGMFKVSVRVETTVKVSI